MNGVSEDIFNELVQNAQLSPADIQTILNLNKLGVTIDADVNYFYDYIIQLILFMPGYMKNV